MSAEEQWKVVPSLPAYEVNERGAARLVRTGRLVSPKPKSRGYIYLATRIDGVSKNKHLAAAVLEAFVGPRPDGCHAAHNNGDPLDNSLDNLRWATPRENCADKVLHGTAQRGVRNAFAKLTDADVLRIVEMKSSGISTSEIARTMGVSRMAIYLVVSGKGWTHVAGMEDLRARLAAETAERGRKRSNHVGNAKP